MVDLLNKMIDNLIQEAIDDETFDHSGTWESTIHVLKAYIAHLKGQIPKWEPIETANEDDHILGYDPNPDISIQAMRVEHHQWSDSVYHEWAASPTHWMPLPKPPKES